MNYVMKQFCHNILINILIISSFSSIFFSSCIIIFPFELISPNYKLSSSEIDLMSYLYNLSLYMNISIGSPQQQIKSFIKFDKSGFNIPNNAYNHKISESYKEIEGKKKIYDEIEYNGSFSSDNIKLINIDATDFYEINHKIKDYNEYDKYKIYYENISFINKLSDEIGYKDYGYIGLKYPDIDKSDIINFIPLLKYKNIIKNVTWTLLFDSKNENKILTIDNFKQIKGKLILGNELYNYYPCKYMNNLSYSVNMLNRNYILNWDLGFSNIYINDLKLYITTIAEMRPDSALNFGTLVFKFNIDIQFFSPLLNQSICEIKNMSLYPNIMYYMCDITKKGENNLSFDINKFPNLIFEHKILEKNFTFTYKDLFIQDINNKNIYYFLFVFDRNKIFSMNEDRFILGMKFFEKYQFEFDNDKKLIRYYDTIDIIDNREENKNNENSNNGKKDNNMIIYICLIILFGIILFVLGMLFQKKILKLPKKKRANELDDDYEYMAKNEEKKESVGLGINE